MIDSHVQIFSFFILANQLLQYWERSKIKEDASGAPSKAKVSNKRWEERETISVTAMLEALKDDHDAFTVVIGSRASVLDGEDDGDANHQRNGQVYAVEAPCFGGRFLYPRILMCFWLSRRKRSRIEQSLQQPRTQQRIRARDDEDQAPPEAPKKWRDYSVEFHFPDQPNDELTPPLLQPIEVSFSYPNRDDFKLSNVDMGTRDLVPGEVRRSQKLRIGKALCGSSYNG
ncbi:hypothetical protein OIU84_020302 [Salix udensis]|uniref:Uncharacterized protein n=1 Tax=Salix udensis TaxID=889485 RepID=A0AAD6PHJ1_9ROSI|nr:hypothetical protein OIU84_020302 [Salix udensis]